MKKLWFRLYFTVFLLLSLVTIVKARTYTIPDRPIYFPSKSGATITFDRSLLPMDFTTLYKDSSARWHFDSYWVTTTVDLSITCWFTDNWLKYTVAVSGVQEIYVGTKPVSVTLDGITQSETNGWIYSNGIITVTGASSSVALYWQVGASAIYILTVYTTANGDPVSAKISVKDWYDQVSDINGNAYFNLPYGDYEVIVTYAGRTQNKTVGLYGNLAVAFDFELSSPSSGYASPETIKIFVGLGIIAIFAIALYIVTKKA